MDSQVHMVNAAPCCLHSIYITAPLLFWNFSTWKGSLRKENHNMKHWLKKTTFTSKEIQKSSTLEAVHFQTGNQHRKVRTQLRHPTYLKIHVVSPVFVLPEEPLPCLKNHLLPIMWTSKEKHVQREMFFLFSKSTASSSNASSFYNKFLSWLAMDSNPNWMQCSEKQNGLTGCGEGIK